MWKIKIITSILQWQIWMFKLTACTSVFVPCGMRTLFYCFYSLINLYPSCLVLRSYLLFTAPGAHGGFGKMISSRATTRL